MDRGTRGGDGVRHCVGLCSNRVGDAKLDVLGAIGRHMPGEIRDVGLKGLKKVLVVGDVQTGKNVFGAGGVGVELYFNDYIDLIAGPVVFIDKALQPGGKRTLWTTQLDVDIPLGR